MLGSNIVQAQSMTYAVQKTAKSGLVHFVIPDPFSCKLNRIVVTAQWPKTTMGGGGGGLCTLG